jgi:Ca-activated chloride channel family protein
VGYLLDEIRLRGENSELKDEVVQLARQYNIVTPYTAYLIVEDEGRRGVAMERRFYGERANDAKVEFADSYFRLKEDKDGAAAVSGARSLSVLKRAEAPAEATATANFEVNRPATPAPATQPRARGDSQLHLQAATGGTSDLRKQMASESSRFVAGKTFFFNRDKWVDTELQKLSNSKAIRIQFGSTEYFDLLAKNPSIVKWLAIGPNVQFELNGTAYEVYE